jgi:hypothetical protein
MALYSQKTTNPTPPPPPPKKKIGGHSALQYSGDEMNVPCWTGGGTLRATNHIHITYIQTYKRPLTVTEFRFHFKIRTVIYILLDTSCFRSVCMNAYHTWRPDKRNRYSQQKPTFHYFLYFHFLPLDIQSISCLFRGFSSTVITPVSFPMKHHFHANLTVL